MTAKLLLKDYYVAVASKLLSAVDAETNRSNQHEFGGLVSAGFLNHLGEPGDEAIRHTAKFHYFDDDIAEPVVDSAQVSWYDARANNPDRAPELRLYYQSNAVSELLYEGDLFIIAKRPDFSFHLIFAPGDSEIAKLLCELFQIQPNSSFQSAPLWDGDSPIDLTRSTIFQTLDITPEELSSNDFEDLVTFRFGTEFPTTKEFSAYARETLGAVPITEDPDSTLLLWMRHEEALFTALEKVLVEEKLADGFESVEDFIAFSLSVQNRRKSRAGHALENHLGTIFSHHALEVQRGGLTENRSKPDFLFPNSEHYSNSLDGSDLLMLGVKTTCKDRWRQVLAEARKIPSKHLLTLEPAISLTQLQEMRSNLLQLVVPAPLHESYDEEQQTYLISLSEFIELALNTQLARGNTDLFS